MAKVVLGGLLAGIVVFFWGAFSHMVLPLGKMGVHQITNEEPVIGAVHDSVREPGFYFFPGRDMSKQASESEEQVWMEKVKKGPVGVLIVQPSGGEAMSPRQLGTELATNVVSALLAAFLLTSVRSGYWGGCECISRDLFGLPPKIIIFPPKPSPFKLRNISPKPSRWDGCCSSPCSGSSGS